MRSASERDEIKEHIKNDDSMIFDSLRLKAIFVRRFEVEMFFFRAAQVMKIPKKNQFLPSYTNAFSWKFSVCAKSFTFQFRT
jgi:hypothetical protein